MLLEKRFYRKQMFYAPNPTERSAGPPSFRFLSTSLSLPASQLLPTSPATSQVLLVNLTSSVTPASLAKKSELTTKLKPENVNKEIENKLPPARLISMNFTHACKSKQDFMLSIEKFMKDHIFVSVIYQLATRKLQKIML